MYEQFENECIYLDPNNLTEEDLGTMVIDSEKNMGFITRDWTGDLVRSAEKEVGGFGGMHGREIELNKPAYTYHYENIVYGEPYIKPMKDRINIEGDLIIIGKLQGDE